MSWPGVVQFVCYANGDRFFFHKIENAGTLGVKRWPNESTGNNFLLRNATRTHSNRAINVLSSLNLDFVCTS